MILDLAVKMALINSCQGSGWGYHVSVNNRLSTDCMTISSYEAHCIIVMHRRTTLVIPHDHSSEDTHDPRAPNGEHSIER